MDTESPIVKEVRNRRMKISAKYGHDIHRYCEHLMELQDRPEYRGKLVTPEKPRGKQRKTPPRVAG